MMASVGLDTIESLESLESVEFYGVCICMLNKRVPVFLETVANITECISIYISLLFCTVVVVLNKECVLV